MAVARWFGAVTPSLAEVDPRDWCIEVYLLESETERIHFDELRASSPKLRATRRGEARGSGRMR